MRGPRWYERLRFLVPILGVDAALALMLAIICALGGWLTVRGYGIALLLGGAPLMGIGLAGLLFGWQNTRSFTYQFGMSASGQTQRALAEQEIADVNAGTSLIVRLFGLGLLPAFVGMALVFLG